MHHPLYNLMVCDDAEDFNCWSAVSERGGENQYLYHISYLVTCISLTHWEAPSCTSKQLHGHEITVVIVIQKQSHQLTLSHLTFPSSWIFAKSSGRRSTASRQFWATTEWFLQEAEKGFSKNYNTLRALRALFHALWKARKRLKAEKLAEYLSVQSSSTIG